MGDKITGQVFPITSYRLPKGPAFFGKAIVQGNGWCYNRYGHSAGHIREEVSWLQELRFAWKHTLPILFTYLFIGIAFGVQMAEAGYSAVWSVASAFFIYAGSLQIVMVSLLRQGVPLLTMAAITFFLNARHIFYGIAFIDRFRKMGWRYPYMVLTLTDETYSILCSIKYEPQLNEDMHL